MNYTLSELKQFLLKAEKYLENLNSNSADAESQSEIAAEMYSSLQT